MKRWFWLPLLLCFVWTCPAVAADFTGSLSEADRLVKENKPMPAIGMLRRATTMIWNRMPLTVKDAVLVTEKAPRYSQYNPRPDNIYKSGETVIIYTTPVGYHFARHGNGLNFKIACDVNVLSPEGKVLTGQRDFGNFTVPCREPLFEFFLNLSIPLKNAKPGKYILEIVIRDLNSQSQTSFQKAVVVQ